MSQDEGGGLGSQEKPRQDPKGQLYRRVEETPNEEEEPRGVPRCFLVIRRHLNKALSRSLFLSPPISDVNNSSMPTSCPNTKEEGWKEGKRQEGKALASRPGKT